MSPAEALVALGERVRSEGEPLASAVQTAEVEPAFGLLASSGPRNSAFAGEYAFVVEAVREGYLCHYGNPRILTGGDDDLALLAGDLFYAIGINGLAALDDPESVGILSDLIRVAAGLRAEARAEAAEQLWLAQLLALSCENSDELKGLVRALEGNEADSLKALADWSLRMAQAHGLDRAFAGARKAMDSGTFDS